MAVADVLQAGNAFLETEWRSRSRLSVSLRRRLWLYRHGMFSKRDATWDLSAQTIDEYLSDRQRSHCVRIDAPYGAGLKNKLLFRSLIGGTHRELLPDLYGVIRNGEIDANGPGPLASTEDLLGLLADETVVAKPVDGAKGDTVQVLDRKDGSYRIDGQAVAASNLVSSLTADRDLLLEACVSQADYAASVYPGAVNTVRLLTMLDGTGEPFVAAAMHRFGTAASGTVDNWGADGLSAGIDAETGVLNRAAVATTDRIGVRWLETHPDTDTRITGTSVPGWDRVLDQVLDLAGEYRWYWPYVGWDVVVTDDAGSVTVLEGNRNPGVEALQSHEPLLGEPRVRKFFERHGIVS